LSENLEIKAFGKRFEQNAVQAQNRKTVVYFSYIAPKKEEPIILIPPPEKEITEVIEVTEDEKPTLTELFDNAKKGDTLEITDIHFLFHSGKFNPKSEATLKELFYNLASYSALEIEIQARTCCNPALKGIDNLSEKRTKALYRYLV